MTENFVLQLLKDMELGVRSPITCNNWVFSSIRIVNVQVLYMMRGWLMTLLPINMEREYLVTGVWNIGPLDQNIQLVFLHIPSLDNISLKRGVAFNSEKLRLAILLQARQNVFKWRVSNLISKVNQHCN